MLRRQDREMLGVINFHGRPNAQGQAELGYAVFEPYRRQGYASEAALAMMRWAHSRHGVRRFIVSISPANQASLAMADKLGFRLIATQMDDIDGEEHVFELVIQ
jgi:RimJ/RimL family protein N-acetyltransferase